MADSTRIHVGLEFFHVGFWWLACYSWQRCLVESIYIFVLIISYIALSLFSFALLNSSLARYHTSVSAWCLCVYAVFLLGYAYRRVCLPYLPYLILSNDQLTFSPNQLWISRRDGKLLLGVLACQMEK